MSLIGIISYITKLSGDYSKLKADFMNNQERDKEEWRKSAEKFTELYNSRNKTNETLIELSTTMKMMLERMDSQFNKLDSKIDELSKRGADGSH